MIIVIFATRPPAFNCVRGPSIVIHTQVRGWGRRRRWIITSYLCHSFVILRTCVSFIRPMVIPSIIGHKNSRRIKWIERHKIGDLNVSVTWILLRFISLSTDWTEIPIRWKELRVWLHFIMFCSRASLHATLLASSFVLSTSYLRCKVTNQCPGGW